MAYLYGYRNYCLALQPHNSQYDTFKIFSPEQYRMQFYNHTQNQTHNIKGLKETHISSVIVQAPPPLIAEIAATIDRMEYLEVAVTDIPLAKIIVVIEAPSSRAMSEQLEALKTIDGVINVNMVYHHVESDQSLKEDIK
ncbi:MAG: hypothetical protein COA42_17950 [Alteromonadaceae bacterium]|nr:MAG: hypothetical protein COA42_17950 [Alteromonadaceae bacterium]